MSSKYVSLTLVLATWVGAAAHAQPARHQVPTPFPAQSSALLPLALGTAWRTALDNSPTLAGALREVEAAQGALSQAGALQNPSLGIEVEDLRAGNRRTTVTLSQPLELGGKRAARITAAEGALHAARAQYELTSAQLQANVTAAFLATLLSQERVRLAQESLDIARSSSVAASKRVQAGKISPLEETRSKVAEANVRLELAQAQAELNAQMQELRALLAGGASFDTLDGNALQLPSLPPIEELQARVEQSPTMRMARLQTQRLRALADLEQAKRTPDIAVSLGMQRIQQEGRSIAIVGVSIPLPVFDTNRGNIVEALRRRDKSEDDARATELRLRADLAIARQRLDIASQEVMAVRAEILPAAQMAFNAATQGFELGKFEYLDVLDAQRTLLQARAQYLLSLGDSHRAVADVARLLGNNPFQP
ncbi:MAG: TolC family protein [Hydrogenophaga sp.]|uniref:TolC family protein n=1 Tax=Hydrogenophaga sp. TaxID=1904254 RepID=UPI0016B7B82C|nr:TolC family protein [Hydrogenophaga sp.]NIM42805.1 TolC family protein [Hydrogenophaga sp.]NIN27738.1 TolC family protein [Hydrogenophaga sp.]NIN32557.1 TolC family protein [Hydrogenophaga sp.]NIN57011.1 TolC family protein [Hydrogenophaga sp.]NIO53422.1 TolC family protein [Hydrogenophaga sp.]